LEQIAAKEKKHVMKTEGRWVRTVATDTEHAFKMMKILGMTSVAATLSAHLYNPPP